MLPRLFSEHNFKVTIADPPYAKYSWDTDLSIFKNYPAIHGRNIRGKYIEEWLENNPNSPRYTSPVNKLNAKLLYYSFFKCAPLVLRSFIYDKGNYFAIPDEKDETEGTFSIPRDYPMLDLLPSLTSVEHTANSTFSSMYSTITHEPVFFQVPEYAPRKFITNKGSGPFAKEDHYHVNVASFLLLGKWFDYLKAQGVYDNTRIIIVSDHGKDLHSPFPDNITLPNGEGVESYMALLFVKDFDANGSIRIDNTFMTNADVPLLATSGIIDKPVNPFTGNTLTPHKDAGVTITTSYKWLVNDHPGNTFNIKPDEWMHVHDDIYKPENWSKQ
jgi:hypothetical protein